jgi:hypothetical protein
MDVVFCGIFEALQEANTRQRTHTTQTQKSNNPANIHTHIVCHDSVPCEIAGHNDEQ